MDRIKNWIPTLVDVLGLALHIVLFSSLSELFADRIVQGWFVVAGAYLLFCFGVNGLRKLEPAADAEQSAVGWLKTLDFRQSRPWLVGLGLLMAVTVVLIQADINELIESTIALMSSTGEVHEGEVTLYYSFGPGFLWTILGLFYVLVLITKVDESSTSAESNKFIWSTFFGLTAINLLVVVYAAYFASLLGRFDLSTAGQGGALLGIGLLFVFVFGPPRLIHYLKRPQLAGLTSFTIFMVYVLVRLII